MATIQGARFIRSLLLLFHPNSQTGTRKIVSLPRESTLSLTEIFLRRATMRRAFERRRILLCVLWAIVATSTGLPAEQPTRFTLSTGDTNARNVAAQPTYAFDQGREFLGRFADMIRIGRGRLVNSVTLARNIIADQAEMLASESQNNVIVEKSVALNPGEISLGTSSQYPVLTNTRPNSRETVRLENETDQSLLEKPIPKPKMSILESFLNPTPLVDGITEKEKYGNSGDKFIGIGRALVSGFEGLSNFLNAIVDFPRTAVQKTSRGITDALNHVGARLIGLE